MILGKSIAIDCGGLKKQRGIANYIENIIIGLEKQKLKNKFIFIIPYGVKLKKINNKQLEFRRYIYINQIIWEQLIVPIISKLLGADIVLFTGNTGGYYISSLLKIKISVVIHDVSFLKNNKYFPQSNNIYQIIGSIYRKYNITNVARYSDLIFTVSKFAKNDIVKELKVNKEKVIVIKNSLKKIFFKKIKKIKKNKIILVVSGDTTQKNLNYLIKAIKNNGKIFDEWQIRIYGSNRSSTNKSNIKIFKHTNPSKLINEYDKASILIMPSLYESFGIPIIEAMSRNVLVLASNRGAFKEISNNYLGLFNPESEKSLIDNFNQVKNNLNNRSLINQARQYALTHKPSLQAKLINNHLSGVLEK